MEGIMDTEYDESEEESVIHIVWTNGDEGDYKMLPGETHKDALRRISKEHGRTTAAIDDWWWV